MMQYLPNPFILPVGLIMGVLVAAPVGPVNVLCIQRAIERGFWGGVAAGIGSVMADGLIALLAGLGVGAVTGALHAHRAIIQVIGGLALLAFGIRLYHAVPRVRVEEEPNARAASLRDFAWDIPKTFLLTVTNPGSVLGLFAVFGGVSTFVEVQSTVDVLLMVAAIVAGSLMWWIFLSNFIGHYRHRMGPAQLRLVNTVAGVLMMGFGALLLAEVVWKNGNF